MPSWPPWDRGVALRPWATPQLPDPGRYPKASKVSSNSNTKQWTGPLVGRLMGQIQQVPRRVFHTVTALRVAAQLPHHQVLTETWHLTCLQKDLIVGRQQEVRPPLKEALSALRAPVIGHVWHICTSCDKRGRLCWRHSRRCYIQTSSRCPRSSIPPTRTRSSTSRRPLQKAALEHTTRQTQTVLRGRRQSVLQHGCGKARRAMRGARDTVCQNSKKGMVVRCMVSLWRA
mmetsp:Transcript_18932/g.53047  ORF Transcript_18932/g.53047 Transcript_18932/m.53047 type:complete len:230 (+) Transcript_18932:1159-1848(+)